ncbi:hypothetical protein ACQ5SO_10650 [Rhodovulum sp. DZ06]
MTMHPLMMRAGNSHKKYMPETMPLRPSAVKGTKSRFSIAARGT